MFTIQISDREKYARKAKALHRLVTVVPSATVVPVERQGAVIMHPALRVDYEMEFDDPSTGKTKWTFREVVLTDERGIAKVGGESLWNKLESELSAEYLNVVGERSRWWV